MAMAVALLHLPSHHLLSFLTLSPPHTSETLAGPCSVGPEADIWSCGVVLYFMLSGRMPFQAKDALGVLRNMQKGSWVPLDEHISKRAADLIAQMLEPNPLKRISMVEVICHRWMKKGTLYILRAVAERIRAFFFSFAHKKK